MSRRSTDEVLEILAEVSPELAGKVHPGSGQLGLFPPTQAGVSDHNWAFMGLNDMKPPAATSTEVYRCRGCGIYIQHSKRSLATWFDAEGHPLSRRPRCRQQEPSRTEK